jgi:hypothetical protein
MTMNWDGLWESFLGDVIDQLVALFQAFLTDLLDSIFGIVQ